MLFPRVFFLFFFFFFFMNNAKSNILLKKRSYEDFDLMKYGNRHREWRSSAA